MNWRWWVGAVAMWLAGPGAWALDRELTLRQFHHTSWGVKDGAPLKAWQLAQTADGWLWLGGRQGLQRFDGMNFEPLRTPGGGAFRHSVWTLYAAPPNDLWIGVMSGAVFRLRDGRLTEYGPAEGVEGPVDAFVADPDHNIWAITRKSLLRFDGNRWQAIQKGWQLGASRQLALLAADASGTVWVCAGDEFAIVARGQLQLQPTSVSCKGALGLSLIDGALWQRRADGMQRVPESRPTTGPKPAHLGPAQSAILIDRDRMLWTDRCPSGICRYKLPLAADRFTVPPVADSFGPAEGLSGSVVTTVLEDREGTIWVTTHNGLDRFRRSALVPLRLPESDALKLVRGPDDTVMVVGHAKSVPRLWVADRQAHAQPAPELWIEASHRDPDGRLWLAGKTRLWLAGGTGYTGIDYPPEVRGTRVKTVVSDATGLWLSFLGSGVFRYEGGRWSRPATDQLPTDQGPGIGVDAQGRSWFGLRGNTIVALHGGTVRRYTASDGIDVGTVFFVHAGRHVVGAGDASVVLLAGERFHRIRADDDSWFEGVTGVAEDAQGGLWFNGNKGAVWLPLAEIEQLQKNPQHRVRGRLFDVLDGYPDSAPGPTAQPNAITGSDGRLWFAGISGVVWTDPQAPQPAPQAPNVVIRELATGGRTYLPSETLRLAERTTRLELRFTALRVPVPERAVFRVRLEGIDGDWSPPSPRREAVYTNLGPGDYRFRVIASAGGGDGLWSEAATELAFTIQPTLFQTWWFKALYGVAALGLLWGLCVLRLRQVRARMREKMQERLIERDRIARDLHDTLLQGVQGLILRFQAVADQMPAADPAKPRMASALARADGVLAESRERVLDLHRSSQGEASLAEALQAAGRELSRDHAAEFRLDTQGTARPLQPAAQEQLLQIFREALLNAFRHAQATRIDLELNFGRRELRIGLQDNGVGMAADVLRNGRSGHLGLRSMRERAGAIGASWATSSRPGDGTRVELRLRAGLAYRRLAPETH